MLVLDGVYRRTEGEPDFQEGVVLSGAALFSFSAL